MSERHVAELIPLVSRLNGFYVLGRNGTGKTTLLRDLITDDLWNGRGLCVLDPHGDLIQDILDRVSGGLRDKDDVVLFDLLDAEHPCGLNVFSCADPTDPMAVALTVSRVMEVFAKVWGVGPDTPRLARVLRNVTMTLIEARLTMAQISRLLTDGGFRANVLARVANPEARRFWELFGALPLRQRIEWIDPLLNRVDAFLLHPLIRPIVGQRENFIDWRVAMDRRKVVLVRLDAQLAEPTAILGGVIVGQILDAALSRKGSPQAERSPFMLYADEFQRFAAPSFGVLIDEARKYGIATTVAHQRRDQLQGESRGAPLGAMNLACFQLVPEDAEEMAGFFDATPRPGEPVLKMVTEPVYETWTEVAWDPPGAEQEFERLSKALKLARGKRAHLESAFLVHGDPFVRLDELLRLGPDGVDERFHKRFNPSEWSRRQHAERGRVLERDGRGRERWWFPPECASEIEWSLMLNRRRSPAAELLLAEISAMLAPYKQRATYWFTPDPAYVASITPWNKQFEKVSDRIVHGRWEVIPFPEALRWAWHQARRLDEEIASLTTRVERLARCRHEIPRRRYLYERPVRDVAESRTARTGEAELQRYRWEPGPLRSYADTRAEIANALAHQPPLNYWLRYRGRDGAMVETQALMVPKAPPPVAPWRPAPCPFTRAQVEAEIGELEASFSGKRPATHGEEDAFFDEEPPPFVG